MILENTRGQGLTTFKLIAIGVVSVDNLRNLPIGAQYGFSLVFFYILAAITFFIPLAWVTSQMATKFPKTGGSYLWIKSAFGESFSQLSLWLQWLYNMIWYPTIFTFIATTMASLIYPQWENNKTFILISSLGFFWSITLLHCFGIKASNFLSLCGAIIGTLIPMIFIIGLGIYWLSSGLPPATPLTFHSFLPTHDELYNLSFFSNILFSLLGLDVIAVYAGKVRNPEKTFPRAIFTSACLILLTLVLSSLSLSVIISSKKISLINGLMDVFNLFFNTFHIPYAAHIIGWCVVIGGLGIAGSWMIGLAKILNVALHSFPVPLIFRKENKREAPYPILIAQGLVYTALVFVYLLVPNLVHSYWMLSALTAQFALIYYILLFASAYKILSKTPNSSMKDRILTILLPSLACLVSLFGIIVGFIPPQMVGPSETFNFILTMVIGFLCVFIFPLIVLFFCTKS